MLERALRILQVNSQDERGGAAQIASNLHRAYLDRGLDAHMAVSKKTSDTINIFEIQHEKYKPLTTRLLLNLGRKLETLSKQAPRVGLGRLGGALIIMAEYHRHLEIHRGREDFYAPGTEYLLSQSRDPVDILQLHNLHKDWLSDKREYFDLRMLPRLSQTIPVVLTLHDAWLLSGHCAHSFDCQRWLTGCGHCPDLGIYPSLRRDGTAFNWKRKHDIFRQSRLHVITPSHWLMDKVDRSILSAGVLSSRIIPNGVDLSIFHPGPGDRNALGLPTNARIILFAADGIRKNIWKDFETLKSAIGHVAENNSNVIFVALGESGPSQQVGRAEVRFIPYQKDPRLVADYYRAADVYIHASRVDTFPNSIIEALACGTPVIATSVGGIPEQIQDHETGFLTPIADSIKMANRIELLLNDSEQRSRMGYAAVQDAVNRFDLNHQVDVYLDWYQEILKEIEAEYPK